MGDFNEVEEGRTDCLTVGDIYFLKWVLISVENHLLGLDVAFGISEK